MTVTPLRLIAPAFALLALAGCSTGASATPADAQMPAPLARHQYFPVEDTFLQGIAGVDSPRSDADLVRLGSAACHAALEDHTPRSQLLAAIQDWAQVDEDGADRIITAASGSMCKTAIFMG